MSTLTDFLNLNDVEYRENLLLAEYSTIRIGGSADIVIYPDNVDKLISTVDFLWKEKIDYRVLGRMSNILLPDENIRQIIIKTDKVLGYKLEDNILSLNTGEMISRHAVNLAKQGFSGFLGLVGIPGSIGGMLRGNAGAFGDEIGNIVISAKAFSPSKNKILEIDVKDMDLGYRRSVFHFNDFVILSVKLKLDRMSSDEAIKILRKNREKRLDTQPIGMPSLGSTFKRPPGDFAARLIDAACLRGTRIGGAMVSEKHAGFIVNSNNATSRDVKRLIEYIKKNVNDKFGVMLQTEIEIL